MEKECMDSLGLALSYEGMTYLGRAYSGSSRNIWYRAIVYVGKTDGTRSYAVMTYDGEDYRIEKDFGTAAGITVYLSIHPTRWIKASDMPTFTTTESMVQYLTIGGFHPDITRAIAARNDPALRVMVVKTMIKLAEQKREFWEKYKRRAYKRRRFHRRR